MPTPDLDTLRALRDKVAGASGPSREIDAAEFYVVDFRKDWTRQPYITFWGPDSKGYCWSLPRAGRYTAAELDTTAGYHTNRRYVPSRGARVGPWERFGVLCEILEVFASEPDSEGRYRLDDDGGPIVRNSAAMRRYLTTHRYIPGTRLRLSALIAGQEAAHVE